MRVTGYAYPWDVLAPGFTDRATDLGVHSVAVAGAYHATRAATPWQTDRAAMLAGHSASYRPVRETAWQGATLRPRAAGWAPGDSAGDAVHALRRAGIDAALWLVLTHNSALGGEFPQHTVIDCFGQSLPWALCPSHEAVRAYSATLAAECLRELDVSTAILESCGQMGALHQHTHEKTDAVWAPAVSRLLSICCCEVCSQAWPLAPDVTIAQLRAAVLDLIGSGDLAETEDGLPEETRQALLHTRHAATDRLRERVLGAITELPNPPGRIVLHANPDPWATGPLPGLTPATAAAVHGVVVPCWVPGEASVATVRAARAALPEAVAVGGYVTAVAAAPVPDLAGYLGELAGAGADELHLYHLGLAGPSRWPHLRAAVAAATRRTEDAR